MDQEPERQRRNEQPMRSFTRRIAALRSLRRDKRVERLGGYPARVPELAVDAFQPVFNHPERMRQVTDGVARLGAESVDEGTGFPLDNLVSAGGHEWQHRLGQQHRAFQAAASMRLRDLQGVVQQYRHLYELDTRRLHDAEVAVESAMLALSGEPASPFRPGDYPAAAGPAAGSAASGHVPGPAPVQPELLAGTDALAPPRVSRAELRRIFEPHDANRVPHWAEPGFRDPTLLGGRPRSTYLHLLALALAAGADIGAFVQVVELVLTTQSGATIYLVVAGLTAVVLYIAHMTGAMLRDARAKPAGTGGRGARLQTWLGRRVAAAICLLAWGALGFLAWWVRTTVPLSATGQFSTGTIGAGGSTSTQDPHTHQAAFLFLGLYIATGIVAAVGAYFTHNPYRGRYVAALRGYRKAAERAAASANQFGRAEASYQRQLTELQNADHVLEGAQALDLAFTEQLKQSVRLQIASMARDPAVTDAIFDKDHNPYWPGQNGSSPNGHGPGAPRS
jgi:hypothetical protein